MFVSLDEAYLKWVFNSSHTAVNIQVRVVAEMATSSSINCCCCAVVVVAAVSAISLGIGSWYISTCCCLSVCLSVYWWRRLLHSSFPESVTG